jgi:hypothetical protein
MGSVCSSAKIRATTNHSVLGFQKAFNDLEMKNGSCTNSSECSVPDIMMDNLHRALPLLLSLAFLSCRNESPGEQVDHCLVEGLGIVTAVH